MTINIPNKVRWQKPILEAPLEHYSSKQRRKLRQIQNDEESPVRYEILDLDQELTDWFHEIYVEFIGAKDNAVIHDVAGTTINNPAGGNYQIVILLENNERIGGAIFSVREHSLNMAYKVLPHTWKQKKYEASPSLYVDLLLSNYAAELNKNFLSHGKDRNVYGLNSAVGLATFKLSVGCLPFVPVDCEFFTFEPDSISEDVLVFLAPVDGKKEITKAILYCSEQSVQKYEQVTKYPDLVEVEVVLRESA